MKNRKNVTNYLQMSDEPDFFSKCTRIIILELVNGLNHLGETPKWAPHERNAMNCSQNDVVLGVAFVGA